MIFINFFTLIFISDKGIGKGDNPKFSVKNGNGYLVSKSVRGCTKKEKKWIISDEDFVKNDENFKVKTKIYSKEYKLEDGTTLKSSEKIVSYWSKKFYEMEYANKKSFYDTLIKMIKSPTSFPLNRLKDKELKKYLKKEVIIEDTGEIVPSDKIKALIDEEKIKEELSLLGWYSIITSETTMSEDKIIETYHNLVEIEDQFRVMKSTLEARPLHVRTEKHIIAHLAICTISLILLRLIQKKVKTNLQINLSADRIQEALNKWQVEKLADQYFRFNNIDDKDLTTILKAFNLEIPKKLYRPMDIKNLKSDIKI